MTPEQVRFLASGQLAAAVLVAQAGMGAATKVILEDVSAYLHAPTVSCPEPLKRFITEAIEDPLGKIDGIKGLQRILEDPLNTRLESSAHGGFGMG